MIRIGILGSDSSHALAFSKLCNLVEPNSSSYLFSNVRVTMIYGLDNLQTEHVSKEGHIPTIVNSPNDMINHIDAVMILFRDGNLHTRYALPFMKHNIPIWIDKPLTVTLEHATQLYRTALFNNNLLTGGSTCKYNEQVLELASICKSGTDDICVSAYLNFPADIDSPYNGLHFYGPHIAEMLFTIFGYDVLSVQTTSLKSQLICIVKYSNKMVVLNLHNAIIDSTCIIHSSEQSYCRNIIIDHNTYRSGLLEFIKMIETRELPLPLEKLFHSTSLIHAMIDSLRYEKEIYFTPYIKEVLATD